MAWPLKSVLLLALSLALHVLWVECRKSVFRGNQPQVHKNATNRNSLAADLDDKEYVRFGIILPKTSLITRLRQYYKKINDSLDSLTKGEDA